MKNRPLVSIGMPVYNGDQFIRQALESLVSQNYKKFEIIISNNASTDGTEKICMEYAKRDERIRYFKNRTNMGPTWNFNRVFKLSVGEHFMWASCDDYWDPDYIGTCLETLNNSKDIVLSGTICRSIDTGTNQVSLIDKGFSTIGLRPDRRYKLYKSIIHSGNHIGGIFYGLYKKDALGEVMPIKEMIAADHLIIADLALRGEFNTTRQVLFYKRWGGISGSIKKIAVAIGVKNRFLILAPYLYREYHLQKIIFENNHLSSLHKFKLSLWSLYNYFVVNIIKMTFMQCKIYLKRGAIKIGEWNLF